MSETAKDFQEYFGRLCLVQTRDPIAMAEPAAEAPIVEPALNELGQIRAVMSEKGAGVMQQAYWPTKARVVAEERQFSYLFEARVFPSENKERLIIAYEHTWDRGKCVVQASLSPRDIVSISIINELKSSSRIVAPSSS